MKKITLLFFLLTATLGYSQTVLEDFEGAEPTTADFDGITSAITADPATPSEKSMELITAASGQPWQGAKLIMQNNKIDMTTSNKVMTVSVYSDTPREFLAKLSDSDADAADGDPAADPAKDSKTAAAHGGTGWETLSFDFNVPADTSQPGYNPPNDQFSSIVFFPLYDISNNGWCDGCSQNNALDTTTYVDNVTGIAGDSLAAPTCDDGIQNGDETGIDCGGSCPNDCPEEWIGYVNAFNASDDTFAFGFGYPVADLRTDVDDVNGTVTCFPNFAIWSNESNNSAWFDNPNPDPALASSPNKKVELNSFIQKTKTDNPDFFSEDFVVSGNVDAFGLTEPGYVVKAFIKVFPADFSYTRTYETIITSTGAHSVTSPLSEIVATDEVMQIGYSVYGLIASPGDEPAGRVFGGITFSNLTLSNDPNFNVSEFTVYPNPSTDKWNIKTNGQDITSVQVFDMLGKSVMSLTPNRNAIEVDATDLPAGLYFARVSSENGTKSIKLIKQ